ncbi:MAG TPA: cytochrome b/b6 domain-containing protein [Sphingomicrobium sp.]|nr:cytochrome b/b6 domain-containing protein [Sphingomicrobium sp.]
MTEPKAAAIVPIAVWDLPTRLFHWMLVGLIAFSWWTAEQQNYDLHFWAGMAVLTLLVFRLLWGLFGSSTARFANFVKGPAAVRDYLAGNWRGIGHSPLGALSVIALLGLIAVQGGLGLFASDEDGLLLGPLSGLISGNASGEITRLHKDAFNILLAFIGVHVAAVLFYWLAKRQNLVKPMVTGRADLDPEAEPMQAAKWWVAAICFAVAIGVGGWILAGAPPFGP